MGLSARLAIRERSEAPGAVGRVPMLPASAGLRRGSETAARPPGCAERVRGRASAAPRSRFDMTRSAPVHHVIDRLTARADLWTCDRGQLPGLWHVLDGPHWNCRGRDLAFDRVVGDKRARASLPGGGVGCREVVHRRILETDRRVVQDCGMGGRNPR